MKKVNISQIPVVLLAGGLGTRLSEETNLKPKPMVDICEKPIIHHIMEIYSSFGFKNFIICGGYKQYVIKEYFSNLQLHQSNVTFNFSDNSVRFHNNSKIDWNVTVVDTGLSSGTWNRLYAIKDLINTPFFMCTYGDGVGSINILESLKRHSSKNRLATVTITKPQGRFGHVILGGNDGGSVVGFGEKKDNQGSFVNAGFFVFSSQIFQYEPSSEDAMLETGLLNTLVEHKELNSYIHRGFWHPMDTLRDKQTLESIWSKHRSWNLEALN